MLPHLSLPSAIADFAPASAALIANPFLPHQLISPSPPLSIGHRVTSVQATLGPSYGIPESSLSTAFDHLLQDDEVFQLGSLECTVRHLPGHTPDSIGIQVGDCVFAGDSIFLYVLSLPLISHLAFAPNSPFIPSGSMTARPDVGSARADFPGGSASSLYSSTQFLLALPPTTRIFSGHDYPPNSPQAISRDKSCFSTVADQRLANLHVRDGVSAEQFEKMRRERDEGLGTPRLLHASLQVNLRGGRLPERDEQGRRWMRVPVEVTGEGGEDL